MSAIGLINSRCSVYVVENLAAGEILYNKRGEGWPDVITVIVDRANDNVMISGSVELGREIESF
ncbi:MAG TPA: hypothetical protein DCM45_00980 [Clostridiales bacterium]|nr:hypothetical protein [Clostridiales bacterium]